MQLKQARIHDHYLRFGAPLILYLFFIKLSACDLTTINKIMVVINPLGLFPTTSHFPEATIFVSFCYLLAFAFKSLSNILLFLEFSTLVIFYIFSTLEVKDIFPFHHHHRKNHIPHTFWMGLCLFWKLFLASISIHTMLKFWLCFLSLEIVFCMVWVHRWLNQWVWGKAKARNQ